MNKYIKSLIALTMASAVAASVQAKDDNAITAADLKAVPELQQAQQTMSSSGASMRCLVDTPAWDYWGSPECFSAGFARSATAYFQIDNGPSNYTVYWSDSRCSSSSLSCVLPISAMRSITLTANVLNHSNNTFATVSATAYYEDYR
jgi:hypothetical protein